MRVSVGKPLADTKIEVYRDWEKRIREHIEITGHFESLKQIYVLQEYMTLSLKATLSPSEQNKKVLYKNLLDWKNRHIEQLITLRADLKVATSARDIAIATEKIILSMPPYDL